MWLLPKWNQETPAAQAEPLAARGESAVTIVGLVLPLVYSFSSPQR